MTSKLFDVEPHLRGGLTAFGWSYVFLGSFGGTIVLSLLLLALFNFLPRPVVAGGTMTCAALMFLAFIASCMFFIQRGLEQKAGYTTIWADESRRQYNEVDPCTGLIIRLAGDEPLSGPQSRRARAEAKQRARQLRASGAPYRLPFGWIRPRSG
jgi:hypothetical protein